MSRRCKQYFSVAGGLFIAFLVFTVLVANVWKAPVGPLESEVGLSGLNKGIWELFGGYHPLWKTLSSLLGAVVLLVPVLFAALAVLQAVLAKSPFRVDADLVLLMGIYILMALLYLIFEVIVINYRPVVFDEGLEASYPSSHTLMAVTVMGTSIIQMGMRIMVKKVRKAVQAAMAAVMVLTVLFRFLSGAHWFTDILGGLILGASLVMFYFASVYYVRHLPGGRGRRRN